MTDTIRDIKAAQDRAAKGGKSNGEADRLNDSGFRLIRSGQGEEIGHIDELIEGLFETPSMGVIFGDDQTFKSFILLDWLLSIAAGVDCHGRTVRKGPTVLIVGEGAGAIERRIMGWCLRRLEQESLPDDALFFYSNMAADMGSRPGVEEVRDRLQQIADEHGGIAAVGLDTLSANIGSGKESNPDDLGAVLNGFRSCINAVGAVGILVHHVGHLDKSRPRGGSNLMRNSDWRFLAERPDPNKRLVTLTCQKQKDEEIPAPFAFEMDVQELAYEKRPGVPWTTLVPSAVHDYQPPPTATKVRGKKQAQVLEILKSEYSRRQEERIKGGLSAAGAKVALADWRALCVEARLFDTPKRFYEVKDALIDKGIVRVVTGFAYPVEDKT